MNERSFAIMDFDRWYELNRGELLAQFIKDNITLVGENICEIANEQTVKAYEEFVDNEYERSIKL